MQQMRSNLGNKSIQIVGCLGLLFLVVFVLSQAFISQAMADTIHEALSRTYLSNPQLNAQRANTRAIDEVLPQARGQWLPQAQGTANAGIMNQNLLSSRYSESAFGGVDGIDQKTITNPVGANVIVSMSIFNGFRGVNGINQAQSQIHQSRELLRNTELTVLSAAASAYMAVLRDTAVYELRTDYVKLVENQVQMTIERVSGGEATMTDVYQAQTFLSQAKTDRVSSFIALQASIAAYKQIIQSKPDRLAPATPIDKLLPKNIDEARRQADASHPLIVAARYNVDISKYAVKLSEGALAPTLTAQTSIGQQWNYFGTTNQRFYQGSGSLQLNVPLYEGGVYYSQVRQAKEKLGEAELLFDQQVNQIHQQLEASWAAWQNAEAFLRAARDQVKNAEDALAGLREELKYGQRTTWEVLNYQATLVNARVSFVTGQRERIVSSYNLLAAIGGLSASSLDLNVPRYQVTDHYDRVKNQFIGLEPWK